MLHQASAALWQRRIAPRPRSRLAFAFFIFTIVAPIFSWSCPYKSPTPLVILYVRETFINILLRLAWIPAIVLVASTTTLANARELELNLHSGFLQDISSTDSG